METKKRPVHLDLTKMSFPPMAILSVMHRISGVLLFLLLPYMLYLLHHSLASPSQFTAVQTLLTSPVPGFFAWVAVCAVSFHLFAGIRHMLMDLGLGEHLCTARYSAYFIMLLEVVVMIVAGVWLWV